MKSKFKLSRSALYEFTVYAILIIAVSPMIIFLYKGWLAVLDTAIDWNPVERTIERPLESEDE